MKVDAHRLFDTAVDLDRRLFELIDWLAERRREPSEKATVQVLAYLLGAQAIAIPLHLLFPGEPGMDLTLLNPYRLAPESPHFETAEMLAFIWRHTDLEWEELEALEEADEKYQAILGVVEWDTAFESEEAFRQAQGRYEIIVEEGVDGNPIHEEEVFWYVAARDAGIAQDAAELFGMFKLLYLFRLGIATDDVGTLSA